MLNWNDIQSERIRLKKSNLYITLSNKYKKSNIYVWNFWYIVVPTDKNKKVIKFYSKKSYFEREFSNYDLLVKNSITVPKRHDSWKIILDNHTLYYLELDNIRKNKPRANNIKDLNWKKIGLLLSDLHSISFDNYKAYIHSNLDKSNFFISSNWILWIYDLVSMSKLDIEYEFAILYLNSWYDDDFINLVLGNYIFKSWFDIKKMYKYTILKIAENIKYSVSINYKEKQKFKIDLFKIKDKLKE